MKPSQFGTPYQIYMPENTDKEDAEIEHDNAEFLPAHFVNHGRQPGRPTISFPMALLIAPVPAILLLLGALALGWRP